MYGGQDLLAADGFDVVLCRCPDLACKGWQVRRKPQPPCPHGTPGHIGCMLCISDAISESAPRGGVNKQNGCI